MEVFLSICQSIFHLISVPVVCLMCLSVLFNDSLVHTCLSYCLEACPLRFLCQFVPVCSAADGGLFE
jgi:hypothetical protein